jgi:hypothetical protein
MNLSYGVQNDDSGKSKLQTRLKSHKDILGYIMIVVNVDVFFYTLSMNRKDQNQWGCLKHVVVHLAFIHRGLKWFTSWVSH